MQYSANETLDVLLNGRVTIIQHRDGYRVSEDSIRLCRFVRPMPGASGIDLGAGCGLVAIVLALEKKVNSMVALELQESLADLARRNVALNGLAGCEQADEETIGERQKRVEIVQGDIRKVAELFAPQSFGLAVSNPPYREVGRGRLSPSAEKTIARHEQACSLEDLVRAAAYLLAPEGLFAFCHLGERWEEIEKALPENGFQVSRGEDAGELVLVEALKL